MIIYSCSGNFSNVKRVKKLDELVDHLIDKTDFVETDLERLKFMKEILDDALYMLKVTDERGYNVVYRHYVHGVRMEDIADSLHICRSRCYELGKKAIRDMSDFIFNTALVFK